MPSDKPAVRRDIYTYCEKAAAYAEEQGTNLLLAGDFNAALFSSDRWGSSLDADDRAHSAFVARNSWRIPERHRRAHTYVAMQDNTPTSTSRIDDVLILDATWQACRAAGGPREVVTTPGEPLDHNTLTALLPLAGLNLRPTPAAADQTDTPHDTTEPSWRRVVTPLTADTKARAAAALESALAPHTAALAPAIGQAAAAVRAAATRLDLDAPNTTPGATRIVEELRQSDALRGIDVDRTAKAIQTALVQGLSAALQVCPLKPQRKANQRYARGSTWRALRRSLKANAQAKEALTKALRPDSAAPAPPPAPGANPPSGTAPQPPRPLLRRPPPKAPSRSPRPSRRPSRSRPKTPRSCAR